MQLFYANFSFALCDEESGLTFLRCCCAIGLQVTCAGGMRHWVTSDWCARHPKQDAQPPPKPLENPVMPSPKVVHWGACKKAFEQALQEPRRNCRSDRPREAGSSSSLRCDCQETEFQPCPSCLDDNSIGLVYGPSSPAMMRTHTGSNRNVEFCVGCLQYPGTLYKQTRNWFSGDCCPLVNENTALFELHVDRAGTFARERKSLLRKFILGSEAYAKGDLSAALEEGFRRMNVHLANMTPLQSKSKINPLVQRCSGVYSTVVLVRDNVVYFAGASSVACLLVSRDELLDAEDHGFYHSKQEWLVDLSVFLLTMSKVPDRVYEGVEKLFARNVIDSAKVTLDMSKEWYLFIVPRVADRPTILEKFLLRGLEEKLSLQTIMENVLDYMALPGPLRGNLILAKLS